MKLLLCRTIILYLCVLFAMRQMGKRQLGELQPEELVSTILISNLASISIESEDNLRWCGKDRAWLERTATANTVLPQEILLLIGNETEDYFLLKKEGRQPGGKR